VSSKNKDKNEFFFCTECGISISKERILEKKRICLKYIFCPACGKKIELENYATKTIFNIDTTHKTDTEDNLDNALDHIINDKDFPESFKNKLYLFIARLSYVELRRIEKEKRTPVSQIFLTKELLDSIEDRLSPIMNKKPILSGFKYLDKSYHPEFFLDLKRYQKKLQRKKKYRKAYSIYVRWLIGIVYRIINQINSEEGLYEYQRTIRDDIVQFFELKIRNDEKMRDRKQKGGRPRGNYENLRNNSAYVLLESIRKELERIHNIQVSNVMLSKFLGMNKNYITKKYHEIKNGYEGYITEVAYFDIKKKVIAYFCNLCGKLSKNLKKAFVDYEIYLSDHYLIRSEARSKLFHPNLKSDFFGVINNDDQLYALGIMYSDGFIVEEKDEYRSFYRIGLKCKINDEELIDKFIDLLGLNPEYKHIYEEWQEHNGKQVLVKYFRIYFANQQMANDLISWGVMPNKSNLIRLPFFPNDKDYYPFLMGCFDGDGEEGTTRFWSGSYDFLEDIKKRFKIPNKIRYRESEYGSVWGLSLGPKLFNKMLNSYPDSLERKRKHMMER
jgi:hypothetical protein